MRPVIPAQCRDDDPKIIKKRGTHVKCNRTTGFPSCYNEKLSDASELMPKKQIIVRYPPTYLYIIKDGQS